MLGKRNELENLKQNYQLLEKRLTKSKGYTGVLFIET